MPALTIPNTFTAATLAQSAQVNANFTAVATLLNSTLLDSSNIQALGIASTNLAANSVTGAKLNSNVVDNSTLQYSASQLSIKALGVGTSHLAASAVTTAKIADANVTRAKLESVGQQISSSSGSVSTSSTSFSDVSNLACTITTTGRPVMLMIQSDGSGGNSYFASTNTGAVNNAIKVKYLRGATEIARYQLGESPNSAFSSGTAAIYFHLPPHLDAPAAGTYTYKVQYASTTGVMAAGSELLKLVAYEL